MKANEAAVCWPCVVGFHDECYDPQLTESVDAQDVWVVCCCSISKEPDASAFATANPVGRPLLDPGDITDVKSTGRKRAAAAAPIFDGMLCEWAFLKFAGGGVEPIIGCAGNTIENTKTGPHAGHRHHGPNKNTLDNMQGNLHRICTSCHTYWHALNNKYYEGERPPADQPWLPIAPEGMVVLPHDPNTRATEEEIEEAHTGRKNMRVELDDED